MRAREQIQPATWAAYAHARPARAALGTWPSAETLLELAQGEGADPWALLVLTRGELPGLTPDRPREPTGRVERIFGGCGKNGRWWRPTVLVPTPEALCAVELGRGSGMLYAVLVTPHDQLLDPRRLLSSAREWSRPSDTRVPHRIQLPEARP